MQDAYKSQQALDYLSKKVLERVRRSEYELTQANTNAVESNYHTNLLDQNMHVLE